jgi:hypothetical protein
LHYTHSPEEEEEEKIYIILAIPGRALIMARNQGNKQWEVLFNVPGRG